MKFITLINTTVERVIIKYHFYLTIKRSSVHVDLIYSEFITLNLSLYTLINVNFMDQRM